MMMKSLRRLFLLFSWTKEVLASIVSSEMEILEDDNARSVAQDDETVHRAVYTPGFYWLGMILEPGQRAGSFEMERVGIRSILR